MADRELNILEQARITLNDTNVTNRRWSDERLLGFLSEGQEDLCKNIPLITRKQMLYMVYGQEEYKLPIDSVKLLSASTDGRALTVISEDEIESMNVEWEDDHSCILTHIIASELTQQTIRPYPLLAQDCNNTTIKIRYQALPPRLTELTDELTISPMWDMALTQYIVGKAFLDYGDESSVSRANVALALYAKEFKHAENLASNSFSKKVVSTPFQGKVASTIKGGARYGCGYRFRY